MIDSVHLSAIEPVCRQVRIVLLKQHFRKSQKALIPERAQTPTSLHAAKLSNEQKQKLARVLSPKPSDYGIPTAFWDISSLRLYIKAEFGVEYESRESYLPDVRQAG